MRLDQPVMTEDDFPHGLRCAECHREITEGQPYSERLDSLTSDGIPMVLIVCVGCAFTPASEDRP